MFPIRRCPVERSPVTGRGAAIAHEPTCYPRPTPTDYQQAMSAAAPSREQRPASRRRRTRFRRAARSTVGFWIPRDDSEEQARQGRPPQSDWRHLLPRREGYLDGVDKRPASRGTRAPARPDACKVPANAGAEAEAGDGLGLLSQRNASASLRRFGRRRPRRGCFRSTARAILRRPRTPASGKSLAAAPQAGADGDCRSHVEPVVWPARLAVVAQLLRTSTVGHHCGVGWADQRSLIAGGLGLSCGWLAGQGPDLGRATGAARCARGARRGS